MIIDLSEARKRKNFKPNRNSMYKQGTFEVIDVQEGGLVVLKQFNETYKLLLDYPVYKSFSVGQKIRCLISRNLRFVYWEIEYKY